MRHKFTLQTILEFYRKNIPALLQGLKAYKLEQPAATRMQRSSFCSRPAGMPALTSSANMSLGCITSRQYILDPSDTSMPCSDPAAQARLEAGFET